MHGQVLILFQPSYNHQQSYIWHIAKHIYSYTFTRYIQVDLLLILSTVGEINTQNIFN
jgi:hypothetical protein